MVHRRFLRAATLAGITLLLAGMDVMAQTRPGPAPAHPNPPTLPPAVDCQAKPEFLPYLQHMRLQTAGQALTVIKFSVVFHGALDSAGLIGITSGFQGPRGVVGFFQTLNCSVLTGSTSTTFGNIGRSVTLNLRTGQVTVTDQMNANPASIPLVAVGQNLFRSTPPAVVTVELFKALLYIGG